MVQYLNCKFCFVWDEVALCDCEKCQINLTLLFKAFQPKVVHLKINKAKQNDRRQHYLPARL